MQESCVREITEDESDVNQNKTSVINEICTEFLQASKMKATTVTSENGTSLIGMSEDKSRVNDTQQSENLSKNGEPHSPATKKIIRQNKYYIHSSWLALQSSYFRSLLFGGMKESIEKEVHIQICENEERSHSLMLEAMYKIGTLHNASVDELLGVLRLAHKYDVTLVFKKCKYCLISKMSASVKISDQIMRFIKDDNLMTDVDDLLKFLQSTLARKFCPLDTTWRTESFKKLCHSSVLCLLSSDELVAESENTVFHALMDWVEQHGIEKVLERKELPSLLSVVRFELMSIDYLHNVVQHHAVAKKFADFNNHYIRGINYHAVPTTMKEKLLHQPVLRNINKKSFIPYTWLIPRDRLDTIVGTKRKLHSHRFWYCGYEFILIIAKVVKVGVVESNQTAFKAILCLVMHNVTEQSEVKIKWQPKSESFVTSTPPQPVTFVKKSEVSIRYIDYKMDVPKEEPCDSNENKDRSNVSAQPCLSIDINLWLM